jgi:hypothetical protein
MLAAQALFFFICEMCLGVQFSWDMKASFQEGFARFSFS